MSFRSLFICLMILALSACTPFVKKQEVKKVSKVAIVSLQANRTVNEVTAKGKVKSWRLIDQRIIARQYARNFEKLIRQRMKWKVLPYHRVTGTKAYRRLFRRKGELSQVVLPRRQYIYPTRLRPISLENKHRNETLRSLGKLAKRLRVDALVLIHGEYSYRGENLSPLGTGQAWLMSQSWFQLVDKNGQLIVDMPKPNKNKYLAQHNKRLTIIKGNLRFFKKKRKKYRQAFISVARNSSEMAIERLKVKLK